MIKLLIIIIIIFLCLLLIFGVLAFIFFFSCFWVFMVDSSKVRVVCPLISFLFARLGAFLDTSSVFFPLIENFIFEGCGLGVVVGELFPVLSQSINWFGGLIEERKRISEV